MEIKEVYKKFSIPPNLAEHMVEVASVLVFIQNNWKGLYTDWNKLIRAALLHDLGNIVKFDMDKYPEFLGKEKSRINYWKKVQKEIIEKYGKDDHKATKKMLEEIGEDSEIIKIILDKSFGNSIEISIDEKLERKLLLYADLRVVPTGVVSLEDRILDIKTRMPQYTERADFSEMLEAIHFLEKEVVENLKVGIDEINNGNIEKIKKIFLDKIL